MSPKQPLASRRDFLKLSAATAAVASVAPGAWASGFRSANERPVCAFIGTGIRYGQLVHDFLKFGPGAALCDVDSNQLDAAVKQFHSVYAGHGVAAPTPDLYEDYRRILDRPDIDAVVIATPDHWHVKIAIEALQAGKDVYSEKPLTHNVGEGQLMLDALSRSKGVMAVGTQQRSNYQFQTAAALARTERAGKVQRATCGLQGAPSSPTLPKVAPPGSMNWNRWLGPAPWVDFRSASELPPGGYGDGFPYSRGHAHFRWWYEYAGGKLTDWGAHHVDIALWGLGKSDASMGRFTVDPKRVNHPVEFKDGFPVDDSKFNTATGFDLNVKFEDGVELDIVDRSERLDFDNGVMFECEKGRFFVNRGKLTGKPVEELDDKPLSDAAFGDLYEGLTREQAEKNGVNDGVTHVRNFFDCIKSRQTPISDVASHHRHLTVCHVANIAMRLGRKVTFDPASERFVNDELADSLLSREPREGFEFAT